MADPLQNAAFQLPHVITNMMSGMPAIQQDIPQVPQQTAASSVDPLQAVAEAFVNAQETSNITTTNTTEEIKNQNSNDLEQEETEPEDEASATPSTASKKRKSSRQAAKNSASKKRGKRRKKGSDDEADVDGEYEETATDDVDDDFFDDPEDEQEHNIPDDEQVGTSGRKGMSTRRSSKQSSKPAKASKAKKETTNTTPKTPKPKRSEFEAPKRPKNAYILYCDAMRDKVRAENPDIIKTTEISRMLGQRWNEEPQEVKNRYFEEANALKAMFDESAKTKTKKWTPTVDLSETDTHYIFILDFPGMRKDDIKIDLSDQNILTIHGENIREKRDPSEKIHMCERSYGAFKRRFQLPKNVDAENMTARFENGVLEITVLKTGVLLQPMATTSIDTAAVAAAATLDLNNIENSDLDAGTT